MDAGFIARAVYHDQPRVDTQVATWSLYRRFGPSDSLEVVYQWAQKQHGRLLRIEIDRESV